MDAVCARRSDAQYPPYRRRTPAPGEPRGKWLERLFFSIRPVVVQAGKAVVPRMPQPIVLSLAIGIVTEVPPP